MQLVRFWLFVSVLLKLPFSFSLSCDWSDKNCWLCFSESRNCMHTSYALKSSLFSSSNVIKSVIAKWFFTNTLRIYVYAYFSFFLHTLCYFVILLFCSLYSYNENKNETKKNKTRLHSEQKQNNQIVQFGHKIRWPRGSTFCTSESEVHFGNMSRTCMA